MRHFLNLTHPQARAVAIINSAIIWSLIFIAGYEYAFVCDWLDGGGMIHE